MAGPRRLGRIAGAFYLVNIVLGAFAIGTVPSMLFVSGDAGATAHNLQAHELLYRLSIAAGLVGALTNFPLALIFYELFKVANRRLALLVVYFTLVATAVQISYTVNQFEPLMLLSGAPYSHALGQAQIEALAYQPFAGATLSYDVSSVIFAFYAIAIGVLIFGSRLLPRVIGLLMIVDGIGYLVYGFSEFLVPGFAAHLVPWIQLPVLAGEGSLCLWMLIPGVNEGRWIELERAGPGG